MELVRAKTAFAIACIVATIAASRSRRLQTIGSSRFDALAIGALAATRLGVWGALYVVARMPVRSDASSFYVPEGLEALAGRIPYRDFATSYAPLFSYLTAGVLSVWRSPAAIVLLAIVAEVASFAPWLRVMRRCASERAVRLGAVLYVLNALAIGTVAVAGENQVLCAAFLGLSLVLAGSSPFASGLVMAAGIDVVKFLAVVVAPAPLLASDRRARSWSGFALGVLVVYGAFTALHADPLAAIAREGGRFRAGSLPYFVALLAGVDVRGPIGFAFDGALAASLVAVCAPRLRRRIPAGSIPALIALLLCLVLVLSKKSFPTYALIAFFPICVLVAERWSRASTVALFSAFTFAAEIHAQAWRELGAPMTLGELFRRPALASVASMTELVLLGAYAALAVRAWSRLASRD